MMIAGVDECGRGPLAGPVVAAAVILREDVHIEKLADSKKVSAKNRAALEPLIKQASIAWAIAKVDVDRIDEINILQASLLAMKLAIERLDRVPEKALIDGRFIPSGLICHAEAVVRGDARFASISAASILAKQYRDRQMCRYDRRYPGYGFSSHKGYPTKAHLSALKEYGITPIHRRTFAPVARLLADDCGLKKGHDANA